MRIIEPYSLEDHQRHSRRRAAIYAENKRLIDGWQAIPWWQFWRRPSFEEQRNIILRNWSKL